MYIVTFKNGNEEESQEFPHKTARDSFLATGPELVSIEKVLRLEPVENCLHILKQSIEAMQNKFGMKARVFLTGEGNFRHKLATILPYKGNRDPFAKPHYLPEMKKYLVDVWGAEVVNGEEADDAMGVAMTTPGNEGSIICSTDKDLNMIPGKHYNWVKDLYYQVDEREAWRNFYAQMLVGDGVDNIPGIPGVGPKTAEKILKDYSKPESMWAAVYLAYFNHYGLWYDESRKHTLADALREIGNLLWIRRYNHTTWEFPE